MPAVRRTLIVPALLALLAVPSAALAQGEQDKGPAAKQIEQGREPGALLPAPEPAPGPPIPIPGPSPAPAPTVPPAPAPPGIVGWILIVVFAVAGVAMFADIRRAAA
jgi:hypothetical protein